MKKILSLVVITLLPLTLSAQSTWEIPSTSATTTQTQATKTSKTKEKKLKEGYSLEVIDGKTYEIKDADRPYLKGAVPEVDGNVVFAADIETAGKTAKEAYDIVYKEMDALASGENQDEESRVAIVNTQERSLAGVYSEKLVFSSSIFQIDFTQFRYVIVAKCTDGNVNISIERLRYKYDTGQGVLDMNAEDVITDELMLADDGTRLKKVNSKFRKTTVDRMREIIMQFRYALQ